MLFSAFLLDVPVSNMSIVVLFKIIGKVFSQRHRTMLSAGAANRDDKLAFSFSLV